jgi:hypothetical protein
MESIITLTNFKWHPDMSQETNCFSATVCVNGKPAFFAMDEGHGGSIDFQVIGKTDAQWKASRKMIEEMEAHAKTLPLPPEWHFVGCEMSLEILISDMVSDLIRKQEEDGVNKKLAKECKTKTLFTLPGDEEGAYRIIARPYGPIAKREVLKKHPAAIFVNDRFGGMMSAEQEQKLLDAHNDAWLKKLCKKKTVFMLNTEPGQWKSIPAVFSEKVRTQLLLTHDIKEFANERFLPSFPQGRIRLYQCFNVAGKWVHIHTHVIDPKLRGEYQDDEHNCFLTDFNELKELVIRN